MGQLGGDLDAARHSAQVAKHGPPATGGELQRRVAELEARLAERADEVQQLTVRAARVSWFGASPSGDMLGYGGEVSGVSAQGFGSRLLSTGFDNRLMAEAESIALKPITQVFIASGRPGGPLWAIAGDLKRVSIPTKS